MPFLRGLSNMGGFFRAKRNFKNLESSFGWDFKISPHSKMSLFHLNHYLEGLQTCRCKFIPF